MGNLFSPTRLNVERYRSLRALRMALHHRIIQTISRQAYDEIGDALGIRHDGVSVFDSEDMTSVMSSADMPRRIQCILTRATCCGHTGVGSRGNSISPSKVHAR